MRRRLHAGFACFQSSKETFLAHLEGFPDYAESFRCDAGWFQLRPNHFCVIPKLYEVTPSTVQIKCDNDPAILLGSGFGMQRTNRAQVELTQPQGLA